ncbi:uncharacterized protein LOC127857316 [Dreissena polymorpha]|uniref:uncharacterized protein LOC127857316 n=1 Tax=Dreissena polymorpha TaxID=45954 RepID=UPI0022642F96|nr:uncharacterized protein LOC127857316 [Dreissena polymorpha]
MRTEFIYCLPANRSFIHDEQYVIYLNAWYDQDTYMVFQSTPILFDFTPPTVRTGRYIREGTCTEDMDFISWTDHIIVCWDGVFSEQQTGLQYYEVSLGSQPHNDDIYPITNVGLDTGFHLQNISLRPGTRYYFTVIAMNTVGLHKAAISDGFIVDTDLPIDGVVFNTFHHRNSAFQSLNESIGISWHGFQDNMSGIKNYFVAIAKVRSFNETNVKYTDAQMLTSYVFSNISPQQGESYIGIVKAVDAAGHQSSIVISKPFTFDMTPPRGYSCYSTERLPTDVTYTSNELSFNVTLTENSVYYIRGNITKAPKELYPVLIIDSNRTPMSFSESHDGVFMYYYSFIAPNTSPNFFTVDFGTFVTTNSKQTLELLECTSLQENETAAVTVTQIGPFSLAVNVMVLDAESHSPSVANIRPESESNSITGCKFEELDLIHASTVYVTVKCVNNVELASFAFSGPVTIYLEVPSSAQAYVSFIPVSEQSVPTTETVNNNPIAQYNKSTIQFEWNDFMDDAQILSYQYRVLQDGLVIVDWSTVIFKNMASINNLALVSGNVYTAEVKAMNAGNLSSSNVKSSLLVSSEPPKLTGLPLKISAANQTLHFEWTDVFLPLNSTHYYSLVIGSQDGFNDIADVQYTRDQVYDVIVPESTYVTNDVNELFIYVSCTYNTGLFSTYRMSY